MNDKKPPYTGSTDVGIADRYAHLELDADTVIIYDREQTHAWIQSDVTVPTHVTPVDSPDFEPERHHGQRFAAVTAERLVNGDGTDG